MTALDPRISQPEVQRYPSNVCEIHHLSSSLQDGEEITHVESYELSCDSSCNQQLAVLIFAGIYRYKESFEIHLYRSSSNACTSTAACIRMKAAAL